MLLLSISIRCHAVPPRSLLAHARALSSRSSRSRASGLFPSNAHPDSKLGVAKVKAQQHRSCFGIHALVLRPSIRMHRGGNKVAESKHRVARPRMMRHTAVVAPQRHALTSRCLVLCILLIQL